MKITQAEWNDYINKLSSLSEKASDEFKAWANRNGGWHEIDRQLLLEAGYSFATKYAEGSAALASAMYDAIADAEKKNVPSAELSADIEFKEMAKAINGALKHSDNDDFISSTVGRAVKQSGADTMLKNASRDGAEFAWIPSGDTCPFCLVLASRGWQKASKKTTNGGHAEHIHTHCNCQFAIRFNKNTNVEGYDPEAYQKIYYDADGKTSNEKLKSMFSDYRSAQKEELTNGLKLDTLSESERRALLRYKSSNSYILNAELRNNSGDISKLSKADQEWVRNLDSALKKMPNYNGDLLRTVDFSETKNKEKNIEKFVGDFVVGREVTFPSYISCSYRTDYNPGASIQMYIMDSKSGKDISSIGADEGEVLYQRNKTFVTIQKENIDGIWYIILGEK